MSAIPCPAESDCDPAARKLAASRPVSDLSKGSAKTIYCVRNAEHCGGRGHDPCFRSMIGRSLFDSTPSSENSVAPEQRLTALDIIRVEVAACTPAPNWLAVERKRCSEWVTPRRGSVSSVKRPAPTKIDKANRLSACAGQLLTKMIQACGLRNDVYIMNVLKCRPPQNRTPLPDEVANCRGYFERQLDIIRPEIICCLGAVAAQAVLSTDRSIGKLRGRFHEYRGICVICTYHPAYLLRNPAAKTDAWEDLKMMMRRLGVELK